MKNAAQFIFSNLTKGSRFEMFNDTFEVYNTTECAAHAVKVSPKTGERMTANAANLKTINLRMVELGIQTNQLIIL